MRSNRISNHAMMNETKPRMENERPQAATKRGGKQSDRYPNQRAALRTSAQDETLISNSGSLEACPVSNIRLIMVRKRR